MGLALGADYVRGLIFRLHAGAELGWCRISFSKLDLIDVRDPSNAHSYGLQLGNKSVNGLLIAPRVGIEWAASDRLSFAVTPRIEVILGETRMTAFTIPLTISYSWYGVFRPG